MKITPTIQDKTITSVTLEATTRNLVREFLVRSEQALKEIGVTFSTPPMSDWLDILLFQIDPPLTEADLPFIKSLLQRLEVAANRKILQPAKPFNLYNLKQALGIVDDAEAGMESAARLNNFLEDRKDAQAKVIAAAAAVSLLPVSTSDLADRINDELEEARAKQRAKAEKVRTRIDAELQAEMDATVEALAKEREDLKKTRAKAKAKRKA